MAGNSVEEKAVSPKIDESEQGGEAQSGKGVTKPAEPTRKEWEEHQLTHVPFRSWCPFCVKGRGAPNMPLDEAKKEERERMDEKSIRSGV